MLTSIKAISLGLLTILILGLLNQLLFIMAFVGFKELAKSYPQLLPWSDVFNYAFIGVGLFVVMAISGMVTTIVSQQNHYLNTLVAAGLGSTISVYLSLHDGIFTPLAILFVLFALTASVIGCWWWRELA